MQRSGSSLCPGHSALSKKGWPLLLLIVLLSGCTQFVDITSLVGAQSEYVVYGSRAIGQVLVCHHAGLDGISVLMRAPVEGSTVVLHLQESRDSDVDLAHAVVSLSASDEPVFTYFAIPLQRDVRERSLYLWIESPDSGVEDGVWLPYSILESTGPALYLDDAPTAGRLSYKLHYSSIHIAEDVIARLATYGVRSTWLLLLSALLFLLPGGATVVWLLRSGDWMDRIVIATGISTALNALLLYLTMTGLRLGKVVTLVFLGASACLIALRLWLDRRQGHLKDVSVSEIWQRFRHDPSPLVLAAVLTLVVAVRVFVVRDLVAPMWGDSQQHTMIAQLIVDHDGLFDSWAPYAPLETFTYHFGFHANVALFHWLSGDPVIHSVIWVGQMVNVLAVLSLYPLATRIAQGNRWAGIGAVLVAGLLSPMPMYYVNWGRYTQLAGQAILPVLMWLTWKLVEDARPDWKLGVLVVVGGVGLGLTHYRLVLVYVVFAAILALVYVGRAWGDWARMSRTVLYLSIAGALVFLLYLPWAAHTFRARLPTVGQYLIEQGNQSDFHRGAYNAFGDIWLYVPWGLAILALGGLIVATVRRRRAAWLMLMWMMGMLILANPYVLGLPGTGLVNNFAVLILFYIPIGVLAGSLIGEALPYVWRRAGWKGAAVASLAFILALGSGIPQRIQDLHMEHAMVTAADMKAMSWIRENTPPDARFLVNGFTAFGDLFVVGADAGWWIPLLADRANTVPPVSYQIEVGTEPDYVYKVLDQFLALRQATPFSAQGKQLLIDSGTRYVYIGQGNGMVGNSGQPILEAQAFLDDPDYRVLYHDAGVWVFQLRYGGS
jgi:hypothetical protein